MAFAASLDFLLDTLCGNEPTPPARLRSEMRLVKNGLLSVGLKIHCLGQVEHFEPLVNLLGGDWRALNQNVFKTCDAHFCLVLPPVGNAISAISLLERLEHFTGLPMFNNPSVQLQVCSPGRLIPQLSALHAIGFYLSSDTLRQYKLEDFATTVSGGYYCRGKRLVIYDAGIAGEFDYDFNWWARSNGSLCIRPILPFINSRTDVLVGPGSRNDICNINLLATLLLHAQSADGAEGYWSHLGELFVRDLVALLERHLLTGLVDAPWTSIGDDDADAAHDNLFIEALQELTAYAAAEVERSSAAHAHGGAPKPGILDEMQTLVSTYRDIVQSIGVEGDNP